MSILETVAVEEMRSQFAGLKLLASSTSIKASFENLSIEEVSRITENAGQTDRKEVFGFALLPKMYHQAPT
jgi:hypothetical protein